jgi:general secretion pathway protein K
MTTPQPLLGVSRRNRGFALIIVLWAVVLIALIVVHLTAAGRTELGIAGNLAANAAAQAAADGAIYQAIFNLLDPQEDKRWPLDDSTHELQVGKSGVTLRLADEAARINPNLASPALLRALLGAVASNREQAAEIASAIAEWVGAGKGPRLLVGINPNNPAAGSTDGPPGEPLQSIDELGRVRGITPDLLRLLRPHLTLFGPAAPHAAAYDPVVGAALAEAAKTLPGVALSFLTGGAGSNAGALTARISATAHGPGKAVANRVAIARIGPGIPHGYAMLAWESNME